MENYKKGNTLICNSYKYCIVCKCMNNISYKNKEYMPKA